MKIKFKDEEIEISVKKLGFWGRGSGLMFKGRETGNLLFEFKEARRWVIHSYFVFFPFLAIWLDGENRVLEREIVKPFRFRVRPRGKAKKLVEIALNERNREIVKLFRRGKV